MSQPHPSAQVKLARPQPTVMKFGGTSLADTVGFERVQQIVRDYREWQPVVVVSAMSRVTDALVESFRAAQSGEIAAAEHIIDEIAWRHLVVARDLLTVMYEAAAREIIIARDEISALLREAAASHSPSPALKDLIVSYGEQLSATMLVVVLMENKLPAKHIDARRCIVTDGNHGNAEPLLDKSEQHTRAALEPLVDAFIIPVLGGFIGISEDGETTTLGRNGSDYTASIIGSALNAREIQIWTDVPGVLTADPRLVEGARTVPQLSYAEAAEMARFGAKVLHHKMVQPAAKRRIPLHVRNTLAREVSGTLVCSQGGQSATRIKAIAHRTDLAVLHLTSVHPVLSDSHLGILLRTLSHHHVEIYAMVASTTSATFMVEGASLLPLLVEDLKEMANVNILGRCAGVYIIGGSLSCVPDILKQLHEMFADSEQVLTSQFTCNNNLILAVAGGRVDEVVTCLHSIFVEEGAWVQQTSDE
jgi:aspartate kinase